MRPLLRNLLLSASTALAGVSAAVIVLTPATAEAGPSQGEIWFGTDADSLETDENGKLTEEGAKTRSKEIDRIPGEEDWELKLHARMGKHAAEGPLYIEFYQTVQGKEYIVLREEDPNYDGSRYYTHVMVLEANVGFNKNREYRVQLVQNNGKRDLILGKGSLKLIDTGREPEGGAEPEEVEEPEEDEDEELDEEFDEDEDEDDEGEVAAPGAEGGDEAPPAIEDSPQKKKGCSVTDAGGAAPTGLAILLLAGALRRRRERS